MVICNIAPLLYFYMKIKQLLFLAVLSPFVGLLGSAQAAPLVSIGESVDVFFNGSSSLQWQSNVFYDEASEVEDLKLTVSPGFEVNVGRGQSNADLRIITRYDIVRYDDLSALDNELFHIQARSSYQSGHWDVNGSVSYDEDQSSGLDGGSANLKGKIIESQSIRANVEGEYRLSPKLSVGSGVAYSDRQYQDEDALADRKSYAVPVDVFYELTPKVDLSIGYRYTTAEVGETKSGNAADGSLISGYDREEHFFNVGARGELLPKLNGFFKVGYRTYDSGDSSVQTISGGGLTQSRTNRASVGRMGVDASLTHSTTPKLMTSLKLHRGFGIGGEGQGTEITSVDLSSSYTINANYSASVNAGYTLREYTNSGREDNGFRTNVRLSYVPNTHWSFSAGYYYYENNSSQLGQSYEAHNVDLSASLRY